MVNSNLISKTLKGTCTASKNMYTEITCDFNPTHVVLINPDNHLLFWDKDFGDYFYFNGTQRAFVEQPNQHGVSYIKVVDNKVYIGRYNTGVEQTWKYYIYE